MKFKHGDVIKCVSNGGLTKSPRLILGHNYTVDYVTGAEPYHLVYFNGDAYGYASVRFELAYVKDFNNKLEDILNEKE